MRKESILESVKEHFSGSIAEKNIKLVDKTYQEAMERKDND